MSDFEWDDDAPQLPRPNPKVDAYIVREPSIRRKDRVWLEKVRDWTDRLTGMYSGMTTDGFPDSVEVRLTKLGFVERFYPHNLVHHDRLVITDLGRRALDATKEETRG